MPQHDTTDKVDIAAAKQARMKRMVEAGLSYRDAEVVDDLAVHATQEALKKMIDTLDRSGTILNLSEKLKMVVFVGGLEMVHAASAAMMKETIAALVQAAIARPPR